jgi:hypothetical protein
MMGESEALKSISDLKKALSKLGMSREELKRLLKKIRECKSLKCQMAKACCDCRGKGENVSMEELKAFIESNCSSEEAAALLACSFPGQGGVSRGRGDAAMSWKQRELDFPHKFKSEELNNASPSTLKGSELVGRSAGAPTKGDIDISAPGTFSNTKISSRESSGFAIQPRYRKTVRKYFEQQ